MTMLRSIVLILLASLAMFGQGSTTATLTIPKDVEVGRPVPMTGIESAACFADNDSVLITYPDGGKDFMIRTPGPRTVNRITGLDKGDHTLSGETRASYTFSSVGTYALQVTVTSHCFGTANTNVTPSTVTVHVYPRIPVKGVYPPKSTVEGGETADVEIILTAPAPESGTLVALNWTGDTGAASDLPATVVVSAGQDVVHVPVKTKASAKTAVLIMEAVTIGDPSKAEVIVGTSVTDHRR